MPGKGVFDVVDRLAPTVVRTAAVIRKSGLWDMVLICGGLGIYVWALFLLVLLRTFAVILDRHGGRVWNLVALPSLRRAQA